MLFRKIQSRTVFVSILLVSLLAGCGQKESSGFHSSGAVSAVQTIDALMRILGTSISSRKSASLGVFVSEYLSKSIQTAGLLGGIRGIEAQATISRIRAGVNQEDFELLQAFSDVLQIDVQDLLNRSDDRQKALDAYSEALKNIAERANIRLKELTALEETLGQETALLKKERGALERTMKSAVKEKKFTEASEAQKSLSEKEAQLSEKSLRLDQVRDLIKTHEDLLSIFQQRSSAIRENREALLSGVTVVDMPGIEELNLIERIKKENRRRGGSFDDLFEDANLP